MKTLDPMVLQRQKLEELNDLLIKENGVWTCRKCRKTYQNKFGLRRHAEHHVKSLLYSCTQCDLVFPRKSSLSSHNQANHRLKVERDSRNPTEKQKEAKLEVEKLLTKEGGDWRCQSCSKTFPLKHSLRLHAERHVRDLSFPCSRCSRNFPTRIRLRRHQWEKHRKPENKDGNIPDQEAINEPTETEKKELEDLHQQALKEVESLVVADSGGWKCKECSRTFSQRLNLLYHGETHVSGLYYPCSLCTKTFNTRSRLGRHRFENHKDKIRQYKKEPKAEVETILSASFIN